MNQVPVPNQPMVGLPPPSLGQNRPPMQQYSQVTNFFYQWNAN